MNEASWGVTPADWAGDQAELLAVRTQVFVHEQGVPLDLELDGRDAAAWHLLARNNAGQAIGTGRMLADGHIGRMAVLPGWRGHGVGQALLQGLLRIAHTHGLEAVFLHAQVGAIGFYERQGFRCSGDIFMDAGIPHQTMRRRLQA